MSGTATATIRTRVAGMNVDSVITRNDELEQAFRNTMDAGKAGTLSTRTDANTGIATVATGHGITDADTVSVFWDGGSRYGMTVSATTGTTISVDAGSGDDFPAATTAIVVAKEFEHSLAIIGDDLIALAIGCDNRAGIHFRDAADASLLRYDMIAKEGRLWLSSMGATNPLATDTVANIVVANGGTAAAEIKVGMLLSTN